MRVVLDLEANSINVKKVTSIWCIVCKDIDTGERYVFRNVHEEPQAFVSFANTITMVIGHNILGYDVPALLHVIPSTVSTFTHLLDEDQVVDTLIVSKLVEYSRRVGHSLESYGEEFGLEKIKFNDFKQWSQELEDYCIRDVDINCLVYNKYSRYIHDPKLSSSFRTEHNFQFNVVNRLQDNGFYFNIKLAEKYLAQVQDALRGLDEEIEKAFPPRLKHVRTIEPRTTKHGTLNRSDFRFVKDGDLSDYSGDPFCLCSWVPFNPSSPKQVVDVLNKARWHPVDKTKTHKDVERELNRIKYSRYEGKSVDLVKLSDKLKTLIVYGWKINEDNLATLPADAPSPARALARRILFESRRRTLNEWLNLVQEDGRIHGRFQGIGAWTHRMAHQEPNTANIPNEYKEDGSKKLLGKELRSLWRAPPKRLLVGVDAEGIQFRLFAHYVNSPELTNALVNGRKSDKTDPHSLNQSILGRVCKSRQAAKRYIYALLLGAGLGKLREILDCGEEDAKEALNRILKRYPGLDYLRREVIPSDAKRGYFIGLDGRRVSIPGDTLGERKHLCMSGYLQNGEAIVMKMATLKWIDKLKDYDSLLVNLVHDEWQVESPNKMSVALQVAEIMASSLKEVGDELKLNCPLAGSFYNEDKRDYTIGIDWSVTH